MTDTCSKPRLIVITGPTAVGKTAFTIEAARHFDGEIVSCDSMQLYKYMDIGSAKPTKEEQAQAVHHLVDFLDPAEDFSVAEYQRLAREKIDDIISRSKTPILSGGTGLYINSVIFDMEFGEGGADREYRDKLYEIAEEKGSVALHEMLKAQDPEAAEEIHPNNTKRLVRALERIKVGENAVTPFADVQWESGRYDVVMAVLVRDRQELYDRINERVLKLFDAGLVDEVKGLMDMGLTEDNISMLGIGYKEVFEYLRGELTLEESIEKVQTNTRHFAKRQLTWFRRYDTMNWINLSEFDSEEAAVKGFLEWLEKRM